MHRSVHIAVDRVDPGPYGGLLPDLLAAEADPRALREVADSLGCFSLLLAGRAATRAAVSRAMAGALDACGPGETTLLTFAGHGVALPGIGREPDGVAEAWALHDGVLLDSELYALLARAPAGSTVLVVTDACFAGGMVDARPSSGAPPGEASGLAMGGIVWAEFAAKAIVPSVLAIASGDLAPTLSVRSAMRRDVSLRLANRFRDGALSSAFPGPPRRKRSVGARVLTLAATAEEGLALEGPVHGLFTAALLDALGQPDARDIPVADLIDRVARSIPLQSPEIGRGGAMGSREAATITLGGLFPS
jgi:hypothetical protein